MIRGQIEKELKLDDSRVVELKPENKDEELTDDEEFNQKDENQPKQNDSQENCAEKGSQNDLSNFEFERDSKKVKWYQKLKLRKGHKRHRKTENFSDRSKENFDGNATMSSGDHLITPDNTVDNDLGTAANDINNDRNFKTMEALGIFGLLTPAIAAVPATDEFDTVHMQIKAELGEDWELRLAAAHVDDALKGRGKYGKARSYYKSKFAQRCFDILDHVWYRRIFLVIILIHSLITFIEPPSSADINSAHFMVYVAIAVCLSIYIFDLVLRVQFLSWSVFWSKETEEGYWNGVQFILVCLFWLDFIILCTSVLLGTYLPQPFRCLRLVMLLCRVRSIRHIFEVLAIIGTSLLKVLFIILIFIITFACIGVHLYMNVYNTSFKKASNSSQSEHCCVNAGSEEIMYKGTFDNVGIAILRLFVLLTTENYPEIMLPALRSHSLHFFFFGTFVFFGAFFLTAILLAIVVDSYWIFAKKTIKKERAIERAELAKAWNLLDPLGLGALSIEDKQFIDLFKLLKPKNTDEQNVMLIHLLDSQGDGEIDSFEWTTTLREALNAEFEEDDTNFDEMRNKNSLTNRLKRRAQLFAESNVVSKIILCLILLHGLLFCLKWKGQSKEWENGVHGTRTAITALFALEIIVRIIGFGKQICNLLETLDIIMVCIALAFNCLYYIDTSKYYLKEVCIIISSVAVIIRWMLNSSGPRKAFRWFLNIVPVMFDLVVLLFVILYLLTTIAMEIFHKYGVPNDNQIYPDNCGLGFKNFWCSFMIMFQTLTTSNWHEIMNLTYSKTNSTVAYFFFPISYILITMVVMNLFVAIAIEAANKLTSNRSDSSGNLMHQTTFDSLHQKPRPTFHESAKKLLSAMAKNVIGSARAEESQDRNNRQPINSPTSTATMTLKGSRKGSTTIILSPPSKKRDDNQYIHRSQTPEVKDEKKEIENGDADDDDEDYSGLSPKAKREKQLKNKMKKKRKARQKTRTTSAHVLDQIQKQVRAIASFRGSQPTDLDFMIGDTITVIATRDEWIQGECKGVTGWFPASHVVNWSAKVLHESKASMQQNKPDDIIVVNEAANASNEMQSSQFSDVNANTDMNNKKTTSSLAPQPNYRIKMKSGDWRREILGDMTVMNAEEMRELNKVMRAELRAPGSRGAKPNLGYRKPQNSPTLSKRDFIPIVEEFSASDLADYQLREGTVESMKRSRSGTNMSNDVFVNNSPRLSHRSTTAEHINRAPSPKDILRNRANTDASERQSLNDDSLTSRFPTVSVSQLAHIEFPATSESQSVHDDHTGTKGGSIDTSDGKSYLAIDLPSNGKSKLDKKTKNRSGEMPEWAKKFAETKNISVQNVSIPEPTLDESLPGSVGQI